MINFQTSPEQYKHWKIKIEGPVAQLSMDVQEDQTLAEGYKLKLNSYDLGVDIELADVVQRLRFEHPEVKVVVVRSAKNRVFCAGANIRMLPGTGGLTRLVDKRKVRRDHADYFCTIEEGIKGKRAVAWRLVDEIAPNSKLEAKLAERIKEFAAKSSRNGNGKGIVLTP